MKQGIKRLVAVNVPNGRCNLKCKYCYISQQDRWDNEPEFTKTIDDIHRAFSISRLGGVCLVNFTGIGETLLPDYMTGVIKATLEEGHYVEVVTNGTLTKRFQEIAQFPRELLAHLEFKFSFHYLELKRLNIMSHFFENVKLMHDLGCSITLELMPYDELLPYRDDIKQVCIENMGAMCHLTVGRDSLDGMKILTDLSYEDYDKAWSEFDSEMFRFKREVYGVKRKEFCYAGMWSIYVNLFTGDISQCYGCWPYQNIYDFDKELLFRPIGHKCKQPFCYNAHAYLCLGDIPSISTTRYVSIRDREMNDGRHWLNEEFREVFARQFKEYNSLFTVSDKLHWYITAPTFYLKQLKRKQPTFNRIVKYINRKIKK